MQKGQAILISNAFINVMRQQSIKIKFKKAFANSNGLE